MSKLKLKYLCSSFNTPLAAKELSLESENGMFPVYGAAGLMGYYSKYFVDKEYLGIVKDGAGVGRIDKYPAKSSLLGTMATIIPNEGVDIDWLKYAITSLDLGNSIDKTTIPHIYFSVYGNYYIRGITATEQKKMAIKLNEKCSYVDSLIANQEKQIEKLKAYKQSLITEVVTKGLNPDAPMKPSGVEWIGDIPEGWKLNRLKYCCSYNDEALKETEDGNTEIEYVEIGSVTLEDGITATEKFTFSEAPSRARRITKTGDIIVSTVRTYLRAIASIKRNNLIVSTGFCVIRPKEQINNKYVEYYCKSNLFCDLVSCNSYGISYPAITATALMDFHIIQPTEKEQNQIVDYLDERCAKIDKLIEIKQQKIDKLNDYKKSLIYEYVTGKKEVV